VIKQHYLENSYNLLVRKTFKDDFFKIRMEKKIPSPKISVVMPVYNEEKFLDESIQSILNQTFKDFEFIIINDASIDNSLKIIKKYKDKRIKLINNKKNQGFSNSTNFGLRVAKGKYIANLCADDISHSKRLEKQFNYLEKNLHIFLVGSSAIYIDENGEEIRRFRKYDDYEMLAWRLPKSCSIIHPSIMFHNKGFFYDKFFRGATDYNFYLNLLTKGKNLTNLPEFLIKYRVHKGAMSVYNKKEQEFFANEARRKNIFKGKFKLKFLFKLFSHHIKTRGEKKIVAKKDSLKE